MNREFSESELIFKIYKIKNSDGEWIPAVLDITSHDVTPLWAAAVSYMILDRYLSSIDEADQNDFQQQMLYWLAMMIKDNHGSTYIEKINKLKNMD